MFTIFALSSILAFFSTLSTAEISLYAAIGAGVLGMAWITGDDLVKNLIAVGVLNSSGSRLTLVNDLAPTQTLTIEQGGQIFIGLVDAVFTLPKAVAGRRLSYTFVNGALSGGTGMSISPNALDFVGGFALTVTVDKDLINSGASDVVGDQVTVTENPLGTGWIGHSKTGIFAKQA